MVRLEKYVSVEYNSCKLKNLSFAWGTCDCNQAIRDIEVFGESPGLHNVAVDVRRLAKEVTRRSVWCRQSCPSEAKDVSGNNGSIIAL